MALGVLAAFGAIRVFYWLETRFQWRAGIVAAMLMLVIAAEGAAVLGSVPFDYRGDPREREAYAYLKSLPRGAAIELPTRAEHWLREFEYQYMTLLHGHPIVNGQSGYMSPLAAWLRGGTSPLHEPGRQHDAVEMLRSLDVRYLVIHREMADDPGLRDELMHVAADNSQVLSHRTFDDTTIAVLLPLALAPVPGSTTPIAPSSIVARTSDSYDRLPLLFDGDRDTRWLTGRPQTGDEWLELHFERPRDVRVVRAQLGTRSFGDYPRSLAIDVVEEGKTRTVFQGSVLPHLARGILADGEYPWVEIVLPANSADTLRLRQLGSVHTFFWSIHELQLLEASSAAAGRPD
jgi:hypothetical protein